MHQHSPITSNAVALVGDSAEPPALITEAGSNARYAWEEFLYGEIENENTRRAYGKAVSDLLKSADEAGLSLQQITPKFIRAHFERMKVSIPTKKLRLSAVKRFFDIAVTRHAVVLNAALSVRGPKYKADGKTAHIKPPQVAKLMQRCDENTLVGLRDKTILAILTFTAARVGAVSQLTAEDFYTTGSSYTLKFREKGGNAREIPVRGDLEGLIRKYLAACSAKRKDTPLFLSATGKTGKLSESPMTPGDIRRMLKRRLKEAGLSEKFSPHSFRVCAITDLLKQDVPREDVQYLAGHADARTTALYDRRSKEVTRNIVERISVRLK